MNDGPEWFAPKRYGLGSGRPITWQGWALLIGFLILVAAATVLIHRSMLAYLVTVTCLSIVFSVVCARTTKGGWKWRWGGDE